MDITHRQRLRFIAEILCPHFLHRDPFSSATVPHQYLAPKDGTPLAGLIQDHVIAAVKLTMKDRFFSRMDYLDLVYHALHSTLMELRQSCPDYTCPKQGMALRRHSSTHPIKLIKPAIWKPHRLWTGKQAVLGSHNLFWMVQQVSPTQTFPQNNTLRQTNLDKGSLTSLNEGTTEESAAFSEYIAMLL
ncbi:unnamed protein product [Protopolystoma xenopodis]|uniref:DNA-directed RNA polymerase n=1 Tax=Protopolystoma xenopodis TaxID=117903 RepID=A0A3S4ZC65_9PLAT|nr:unnamed protein product [Protopolystoma xenopodis]